MSVPKKRVKVRQRSSQGPPWRLREVVLGDSLHRIPPLPVMQAELHDYTDVLLGRIDPPIRNGVMTLMEVANAYLARAQELTMLIQEAENDGAVMRGSKLYKFRTGQLRTFVELATKAGELGSRRVTNAQMEYRQTNYGDV